MERYKETDTLIRSRVEGDTWPLASIPAAVRKDFLWCITSTPQAQCLRASSLRLGPRAQFWLLLSGLTVWLYHFIFSASSCEGDSAPGLRWVVSEEEGGRAHGLLPESGAMAASEGQGEGALLTLEELQGHAAEGRLQEGPGAEAHFSRPRLFTPLCGWLALNLSLPWVLQLSPEPRQGWRVSLPQGHGDSVLSLLSGLSRLSRPSHCPVLVTTQKGPAFGRCWMDSASRVTCGWWVWLGGPAAWSQPVSALLCHRWPRACRDACHRDLSVLATQPGEVGEDTADHRSWRGEHWC